ncbi:MAG: aldolase [Clostridia bacterium]|nr:aldolase [Clostridia bacterium]
MLDYMYITNDSAVAVVAENAGVNEIFVDLEKRGKEERQRGMNTVKSDHTVADAAAIRAALKKARLLVRVNPLWEGSGREIEEVIRAGADIVMLPYFTTAAEAERFVALCGGRAETRLLVETPESAREIGDILSVPGIDGVHVGLNDLHLGLGKKFMFELLCDGTVERICKAARSRGISYGFGGVASLGQGTLPAERILAEHYRLGSSRVILSRSFCNIREHTDLREIDRIFSDGIGKMRAFESFLSRQGAEYFENNRTETAAIVRRIAEGSA